MLQEFVHIGARYSDYYLRSLEGVPAPAIVDTEAFSVACVDGAAP